MRMQSLDRDNLFMGLAIELARAAYDNDEVPVGAVIVQTRNNEVISAFSNQMRQQRSSIAHAEMLAIQKANKIINNERKITSLKNIFKAQKVKIDDKITPQVNNLELSLRETANILKIIGDKLQLDLSNRLADQKALFDAQKQSNLNDKRNT